jgi:hypothetical protein
MPGTVRHGTRRGNLGRGRDPAAAGTDPRCLDPYGSCAPGRPARRRLPPRFRHRESGRAPHLAFRTVRRRPTRRPVRRRRERMSAGRRGRPARRHATATGRTGRRPVPGRPAMGRRGEGGGRRGHRIGPGTVPGNNAVPRTGALPSAGTAARRPRSQHGRTVEVGRTRPAATGRPRGRSRRTRRPRPLRMESDLHRPGIGHARDGGLRPHALRPGQLRAPPGRRAARTARTHGSGRRTCPRGDQPAVRPPAPGRFVLRARSVPPHPRTSRISGRPSNARCRRPPKNEGPFPHSPATAPPSPARLPDPTRLPWWPG